MNALLLAFWIPLAGTLLILLAGRHPNARETVSLITSILLFAAIASLAPAVFEGAHPVLMLAEPLPGVAFRLTVEPLGMLFALLASLLWIVTTIYSIGYMRARNERHQTRFYACFALSLWAAVGIAFAGNLFTLYVFYELLTLSTYLLVIHTSDDTAREAGRKYLGYLFGTSVILLLLALVWTWSLTGTLDFRAGGILEGAATPGTASTLLVLFIFGIGKAAVMPFHLWLPAAMVAPIPVSALLHAVAVVKAGVFTILKVAIYIFGTDFLAEIPATRWLMYVAAASILLAALVALRQDNLKLRLAWSTISHLSYIVLGALLATSAGIVGSGMHIVMHAFAKITLFFCAGAILVSTNKTRISEMDGIGRRMPYTMAAFFIASLSIIGLPPLGGFWSKWYLALGALDAHQLSMLGVLIAGSMLNIAYLLPIPMRAFFSRETDGPENPGLQEAPPACVAALLLTATACVVLFFTPGPVYRLMQLLVS